MTRTIGRRPMLGVAMLGLAAGRARAEVVERQARLVINFSAGGVMDTVARLYAERLRGLYAPQVLVDNRPGAAARLGIELVKAAPADGTTVLMTPETMMVVYPYIYTRTLRYDPQRDFIPVTGLSSFGFAWVVDANHPAKTFAEFVDWAKQRSDVPYASPAAGSTPHFLSVEMGRELGMNLVHVAYREIAMIFADLNGGRIGAYMTVVGTAVEQHRAGRVRVLAVTTPRRVASLPDVPCFAELGYGQFTADEWYGIFLPAGTPAPVVAGLHGAIARVARTEEIQAALARLEQYPVDTTPAGFTARLASERERWGPIIRASGYTVEEG
ncbi:tripartite tricarboxylate transporter substrate-binding protein [Paracraurococcus lichenis]|uniref:Tripartite tricarboxylate transporter substrate-binding protein n=1 Tax=Paracraurococcus lichenis TaxID=3064888 RepID=A0ABT9EE57_9PROT|nr:tripartite tricarboxylate transporter substrate-binding protein [Paracraurococcus sp. LOR1-02]MDO9714372.1 tripartite tricarboxylate transporter substrate-binding protein [Paracraurococcus sp. LOR1-02]